MSTLRTDTLQTTDSSFTIDVEDIASQIYVDDKVSGATRSVSSVAALKTTVPGYDGQILILNGYYEDTPGVGGGLVRWDATSTLTPDDGLVIQRTDVPIGRYIRDVSQGIWAEMFGARNDGTDPEGTTNAVWAAIRAMRRDEVDVIQYIGGPTITGYKSGTLNFGRGVFALFADQFDITQDEGLILQGQGSRGKNQALPAATTLLQKGTSSGFFWRHFGNAARSLTFRNLDICYENSSFTGDIIDTFVSPGLSVESCRIGCFGGFAGTRVQTARSAIRATYDEFINIKSTVIDGAQLGFWSDSSRKLAGSNFGGWGASFDSVTFYDIADSMVRHDGTRGKSAVSFRSCAFNPINISPVRAFDVDNIEGLLIQTSQFTQSTTSQPTEQWLRILGCTGVLDSNTFSGPTSKVGTIGGVNPTAIRWSNNRVACLSGLTITGGVITGSGNEYSIADHGVDVVPVAITTLDIGPDIFKSGVSGNSYRISADSSLLGGRINYIFEQDYSNSKFSNVSSRVSIDNVDRRISTIGSLPSTASPYFSGRTYNVTVAGTFTLPTPIPGIRLRVMKSTATALTVSTTSGSNILVGATGARTSAVATAAELGACIEFTAFSTSSWVANIVAGSWTFT